MPLCCSSYMQTSLISNFSLGNHGNQEFLHLIEAQEVMDRASVTLPKSECNKNHLAPALSTGISAWQGPFITNCLQIEGLVKGLHNAFYGHTKVILKEHRLECKWLCLENSNPLDNNFRCFTE